ncbi:MAG: glycosyltransferase family 4 protein [Deltaproteobacteria bacterium]|nr:glycosyltransferase family 4 protein [Deltaproteobacteria bacterium]
MKISIAIEKFDPFHGGAEKYCWDLAHFLGSHGDEVEIICLKYVEPLSPQINISRVRPVKFPQFLRHLTYSILHYLKVRKMETDINFCVGNTFYMDIYQPHGGSHFAWSEKELLRYDPRVRSLMKLVRRANFKNMVQRVMEWWIFNVTKPEVIAISKMVEQDIISWFNYPSGRIHLIPNGIDTKRFSVDNKVYSSEIRTKYGINEAAFVFVFVATINLKLKGFDILVKACTHLKDLPFKVLIAGHSTSWAKNMVKKVGLEDRFIFAGKVDNMEKVYASCNCLVHPSYYDACSLVVIEALASGIRVITTTANGACMFINGDNGDVISPRDAKGLSEAMRRAYSHSGRDIPAVSFKDQNSVFAKVARVIKEHEKKWA